MKALNIQGNNTIDIHHYQPADLPQVQALDGRVQPYRPEDQTEVEAMYRRARAAEQAQDRWVPIPGPGGEPDIVGLYELVWMERGLGESER